MAYEVPRIVRPRHRFFGAQGQQPERDRGWIGVAVLVLVALLGLSAIDGARAPGTDGVVLPGQTAP